jgi:hypothetical protein
MAEQLDVHEAAAHLGLVHQALQTAYCELAQTQALWPKELNEYLYDEQYGGVKAQELVDRIVSFLEEINGPYWKLTTDCRDLSNDLLRVGRGDGFRV